jgi:CRP-like cAMP-binding protein
MEEVTLPLSTTLWRPFEYPKYAHFMTSGITSIVTIMEDGSGVEVGLIGPEGLVEAFHLLGPASAQTTAFIQSAGTALRIPFAELKKEFLANEALRSVILRFVQGQGLMLSQLAACNRLHEIEERLARWLLMVSDRIGANEFYLTQTFLADMVGAQRTTVTLAAGNLQRGGLIEYRRGRIHILDRPGLEIAACECYPIVRDLDSEP